MQLQGSVRKILHGKSTLHTSDRVKKRVEIAVKAFLSAKKLFFLTLYHLLMLYFSTFFDKFQKKIQSGIFSQRIKNLQTVHTPMLVLDGSQLF